MKKYYCATCDIQINENELEGPLCPFCRTEIPELQRGASGKINVTKGDWKTELTPNGIFIYSDIDNKDEDIALVYDRSDESLEANANLIVAAANACIKVNPDIPQAAAEALPDIYDALGECLLLIEDMMPGVAGIALQNYQRLNEAPINARKALAKARKK